MLPLTPINHILQRLPDTLHQRLFAALFNHLMRGQGLADRMTDIEGKRIAFAILDAQSELCFEIIAGKVHTVINGNNWNARIAGNLEDLWKLAIRAEDPDTLFFQRRLIMEGETETGLYIKNMLDGLEFDWRGHLVEVIGRRMAKPLIRVLEGVAGRCPRFDGTKSQLPF